MAKPKISAEDKEKVCRIIAEFNQETFKGDKEKEYFATFKGAFVYINRKDGELDEPISRIKFTGDFDKWEFAIYKWSRENYDPNEYFFPGSGKLDGTVEGALKAGHEAYPPHRTSGKSDSRSFLSLLFGKKK